MEGIERCGEAYGGEDVESQGVEGQEEVYGFHLNRRQEECYQSVYLQLSLVIETKII